MKSAVYLGPRRIELVETERPVVGDEDVVVKVVNCGICGSDLHAFVGEVNQPSAIGGHEVAGEVVEVGSRVSDLGVGDRIVVESLVRCGRCRYCLEGKYNLCDESQLIGFRVDGGFAEFVAVPAYACHRLPSNLSFEQGATVEPLAVAVHGVRAANLGWGESVVVLGSGTIGLFSVVAARAAGARTIIATAKYDHQAALAEEFGATHIVSSSGSAATEQIVRLLDGKGADVVVETVGGVASTVQQALQVVRKGGRVSLIGVFGGSQTIPLNALVVREVSLIGSYCYNFSEMRRDFDLAIDLIRSRRLASERVITHRFELARIQEAFDTALDKSTRSVKVMLET